MGPDDAVGAARQVQHERADADRRRRRDHAVELPDRDPVVEDRAGARLRQHRSSSSRRPTRRCSASASSSCSPRRACRAGVVNIVHGGGERGRRPARPPPGRPGDHAHRLARDGRRGDAERGRPPEARPPRARRQERDHRARRRRPRARGRGDPLVGVRHDRPALHRRVARDRPATASTTRCVEARRGRGAAAARRRLGGRHRRRPGDQQARAREDPLVHARSAWTRARSC